MVAFPGVFLQARTCGRAARSVHTQAVSVSRERIIAARPKTFDAACPICHTTHFTITNTSRPAASLRCERCARSFERTSKYVDLTLQSGLEDDSAYKESFWGGVEIFRRPAVSQVYERGWRQGFIWGGFPGVEREFEYAMEYLKPQYGKALVDVSCGSGLFTRRFAASKKFNGVIALDFSESMLEQTDALIRDDAEADATQILLMRADVGRLPFATASVDAIHAGAAIHCWPNPTAALAEISRVLKPGGRFVGSTFLDGAAPLGELLGNDAAVAPLKRLDPMRLTTGEQYRWWSEPELRDLFASVGLQDFQRQRSFRFILWAVQKPATR